MINKDAHNVWGKWKLFFPLLLAKCKSFTLWAERRQIFSARKDTSSANSPTWDCDLYAEFQHSPRRFMHETSMACPHYENCFRPSFTNQGFEWHENFQEFSFRFHPRGQRCHMYRSKKQERIGALKAHFRVETTYEQCARTYMLMQWGLGVPWEPPSIPHMYHTENTTWLDPFKQCRGINLLAKLEQNKKKTGTKYLKEARKLGKIAFS